MLPDPRLSIFALESLDVTAYTDLMREQDTCTSAREEEREPCQARGS